MIRDINRSQIDIKTAQGERVVLVEALRSAQGGYEPAHIPGAVQLPVDRVIDLAGQYLPSHGAEIVVYGQDASSTEPDQVARQLEALGYRNLYVYRAGKADWMGNSEFRESTHYPPEPGTRVRFDDTPPRDGRPTSATSNQPQVPGFRLDEGLDAKRREGRSDPRMDSTGPWQPRGHSVAAVPVGGSGVAFGKYLRGAVAILAVYAAGKAVYRIVQKPKGLRVARDPLDADDGSEALLAHDLHRVVRIDENSGLEKDADSFHSASAAE